MFLELSDKIEGWVSRRRTNIFVPSQILFLIYYLLIYRPMSEQATVQETENKNASKGTSLFTSAMNRWNNISSDEDESDSEPSER